MEVLVGAMAIAVVTALAICAQTVGVGAVRASGAAYGAMAANVY